MKSHRAKVNLLGIIVLIIAVASMAGYVLLLPEVTIEKTALWMKFSHDFFFKQYQPKWISRAEIGSYPPSAHVTNTPWISYNKSYCASTCLQMIAYKHGIEEPIEYFNFIMGFTYGAFLMTTDGCWFIPGGDPISGLKNASKYLGLEYHMLITNDEQLFIDTCKYLVSKDIPVILPVNMSRLYGWHGFSPHFELLVGYDENSFYLYEPVMKESKFTYGEEGMKFSVKQVVQAAGDFPSGFYEPWKYALIYFTKVGEPSDDLHKVFKQNGLMQIGFSIHDKMYSGSKAVKMLANLTVQGKISAAMLSFGLQMAAISRSDNAAFLKERFHDNAYAVAAAEELEKAAALYWQGLKLLKGGLTPSEKSQLVELLHEAAEYEASAGELLIKAGQAG